MGKQAASRPTKQERRREEQRRRAETRKRAAQQRRLLLLGIGVTTALVVGLLITAILLRNQTPAQTASPAVNAIACDRMEQSRFHIHSHISMYIEGKAVSVPANVGIASDQSCMYWLHTHANNGILHIEAPDERSYTLGDFLRIWQEQFPQLGYPAELAQSTDWQVYVNGKPMSGDLRSLPLENHSLITLAYKSPGIQPDTSYNWNGL